MIFKNALNSSLLHLLLGKSFILSHEYSKEVENLDNSPL